MAFKLGSLNHAKGFIINKLFERNCIGKKHMPVQFLSHGYPVQHRHLVQQAFESLRTETPSLILLVPKRTGRGSSLHVSLVPAHLSRARALMNGYRAAVGLPRYAKDLKGLLPPRGS